MKVLLTRSTDVYISPNERANIANRAKVDAFFSFHENSAQNKEADGYEDYRSGTAGSITTAMHKVFHNVVAPFFKTRDVDNRGMKTASYAVLRYTNMPALLIEHLFISNANDLKLQTSDAFMKESAKTYAQAIRASLKSIGKPNGTVMLDAGHGGKDPGAVNGKEYEKNHMLKLVLLIKAELEGKTSTTKPSIAKPNTSSKIGYENVEGANVFRIQSGRMDGKGDANKAFADAKEKAEQLINDGDFGYVTIVGYKE